MQIDNKIIKKTRHFICRALNAEGLDIYQKYQNIHLLPMYQNKIAYGSKGFPWTSSYCKREINYSKGICPNAEFLQDKSFFGFGICQYNLNKKDLDLIIKTFEKVWSSLHKLN